MGVIARIREAIAHYGIASEELYGAADGKAPKAKRAGRKPGPTANKRAKAAVKSKLPPKYGDNAGHTWSGHGKRPDWFKAALAAGQAAEDLLIKS